MSTKVQSRVVQLLSAGVFIVLTMAAALATAGDWGGSREGTKPKNPPESNNNITSAPAYAPHQVVVKLNSDTSEFSAGNGIVRVYASALSGSPVYLVELDPAIDVVEAAASFSQSPNVEYAQPNFVLNRSHPIQGSYPFSDQNFKGDMVRQYAATGLKLDQAHQLSVGTGVVVGVIDGGIDITHPALGGKAESGYDFVDNDFDANDEPGGQASGHGTFVAGIVHLVAPAATIRSYRVMDASGDGDGFTVARAIERAVADGCAIVNISLALTDRSLAVRDAIDRATGQGVLVIGGAGNMASEVPVYPAAENNALAVGALDSLSRKTDFSSYGTFVDLCAPGYNIYSAYQKPYDAWWSGTSFSAPFVTGLAALTKQRFPGATGYEIRNRLLSTAGNIDAENPELLGALGAGLIDPTAALSAIAIQDSAVFIPETLHYTHHQYTRLAVVPKLSGTLISSNAPALYSTHLVDTGTYPFVWIIDSTGTTNAIVNFYVSVTDNLGTYYNTVAFQVAGVSDSARLTVVLDVVPGDSVGAMAWLFPSEMSFSGYVASDAMLTGVTQVSSTNAPADFTAEIPSGSGGFLSLIDASGRTNADARFGVSLGAVPGAGYYTDTIVYHVDGIPEPAKLIVHLNALDSVPPSEEGFVFPELSLLTAPAGVDRTVHWGVYAGAYGSPKPFSASLLDVSDFTVLTDANGITDDSIQFDIVTTSTMPVGIYRDTILVDITGAPNSPLMAVLALRVADTSGGGPYQCSLPGDVNNNGLPYETADLNELQAALITGDIGHLGLMIGNADVTANCRIDSIDAVVMALVIAGNDSLHLTTCGSCMNYTFVPYGGGSGEESAWVTPPSLEFWVAAGTTGTVYRDVSLNSSNAPATWTATHDVSAGNRLSFDPTGQTNATVSIGVNAEGLLTGRHADSVIYLVSGCLNPVVLQVVLNVNSTDSTASGPNQEVTLSNYPNPFNPSTECIFSLPATSHVTLKVYDLLGREVVTLVDETRAAGMHRVTWYGQTANGNSAASGVYLYRIEADGVSLTRKMLLLK